jgi:hypothetical protein
VPTEPTLLEQLDQAETGLRTALEVEAPSQVIFARSALCAAAAARCMVSIEQTGDDDGH